MGFRIEGETTYRVVETREQTGQTNTAQQNQVANYNAQRVVDLQYSGAVTRKNLEDKLAGQITPDNALAEINALPKPDPSDPEAVRAYKQKRAEIADNAIQNSQPPKREDFNNLPPQVADMEYRDALAYYNSQINKLKEISAEAKRYPDRILTPSEAIDEINKLPKPDLNDPDAVREYNQRKAEIANAALMYAEPPKREDFNGLPPQLANHEYREAKADYDYQINQLKEAAKPVAYQAGPVTFGNEDPTVTTEQIIEQGSGDRAKEIDVNTATPEEVAANILYNQQINDDYPLASLDTFAQALQAHKDDPQYLQKLYQSLGSKATNQLIREAFSGDGYAYVGGGMRGQAGDENTASNIQGAIRDSISTLNQAGLLGQKDVDVLLDGVLAGRNNPRVFLDLFSKLPYQDENLKNKVFTSLLDRAGKATAGDEANFLYAAAAQVLSSTSRDNQLVRLNELRNASPERLTGFIKGAMAGEGEVLTMRSEIIASVNAVGDDMFDGIPGAKEKFGNVEGLILNLAYADTRDSFEGPLPISTADLNQLQSDVFYAAANNLDNKGIQENTGFKDAIASLYMQNYADIVRGGLSGNEATFIGKADELKNFYQYELFTPPFGSQSKPLMKFIFEQEMALADAIKNSEGGNLPDPWGKFAPDGTLTRYDAAGLLGSQESILDEAFDAAMKAVEDDANAQAEAIGLFLSLVKDAADFGGVADKTPAKVGLKILEYAEEHIKGLTADWVKNHSLEELKKTFGDDLEPGKVVHDLYISMIGELPNDNPAPGEPSSLQDQYDRQRELTRQRLEEGRN